MAKIPYPVGQRRRHSRTKGAPKCARCRKFISRGRLCGGCRRFAEHMAEFLAKSPDPGPNPNPNPKGH